MTLQESYETVFEEPEAAVPEPTEEEPKEETEVTADEEKDEDEEAVPKKEEEKPEEDEEGEGEGEAETKTEVSKAPAKGGKPRKLTNQFNFCERAALTYNNPIRVSLCNLNAINQI